MKEIIRKRLLPLLCAFLLAFSGCHSGDIQPVDRGPQSKETIDETRGQQGQPLDNGTHTLLIYMCGSTLESKSGAATKNITEMLQVKLPDNVNVLIQTGGASKWRNYNIPHDFNCRYSIENQELILKERGACKNMGQPDTLSEFILWGAENYPAEYYDLILWDHGGGSLTGICSDEIFGGSALKLPDLKKALTAFRQKTNQKFEFIGFDACLMANYETAYTVEPFAENMIASEEKEPNGGWDYKALLEHLGKDDFYSTVLSSYAQKSAKKDYYSLSHIDLSKFDKVTAALSALLAEMSRGTKRMIISAVTEALMSGNKDSDLYDLGNLFAAYGIDFSMADVITYTSSSLRAMGTGLNIWFPLLSDQYLNEYIQYNPYEPYSEFLTAFYQGDEEEKIQFQNDAQVSGNKFSFVLKPTSINYVGLIDYVLFQCIGEDSFIALGSDSNVTIDGCTVTIDFNGRWASFNGQWLYCTIVDILGSVVIYEAPVKVNHSLANLLFSYDVNTTDTDILGVSYDDGKIDSRLYDIEAGSIISVMRRTANDYGYSDEYMDEAAFEYNENTAKIKVEALPDAYYQYSAFVTDVYGKRYLAGTAVVEIKDGEVRIVAVSYDKVVYPE